MMAGVLEKIFPGKRLPESHLPMLRELIETSSRSQRDKEIVWLRWGEGKTLDEIGSRYGISKERVRQIELSASREIVPHLSPYLVNVPPQNQPTPLTIDDLQTALNKALQKRDEVRQQFRRAIKGSPSLQFLREYGRRNMMYHRDKSDDNLIARKEAREKYRASLSKEMRRLLGEYAKLSREIGYIRRAIRLVEEGKTVYHIKLRRRKQTKMGTNPHSSSCL